jgi:hypothetical protein
MPGVSLSLKKKLMITISKVLEYLYGPDTFGHRLAVEKLDSKRLYYTDTNNGIIVFRPGMVYNDLICLHVIYPDTTKRIFHIRKVVDFHEVDPLWLGALYTRVKRVIDEYKAWICEREEGP